MIDSWLLQHYALAVWITTGVNRRHRKPGSHDKLIPLINYTIAGQVIFVYCSLFILLGGFALPDVAIAISVLMVVAGLIIWALPWLEVRAKRVGIPMLFRKLSEAQRRRQAWVGFLLFWAAFFSMFFVGFSMN